MFELEKSSLFFESMSKEHPKVVQNIEIVSENKISLDITYHQPKHFILQLNNSLRSLLFFIESSIKNSPEWLRSCVKEYRNANRSEYEILKKLRDVSLHQTLIFPKESLVTGLFRIKSSANYLPKIGVGSFEGPSEYSWDLAMKNTDEIFHDVLVFHSLVFMDLEHSALSECLGVTRKWFFSVNFSTKQEKFDQIVDVYDLFCKFTGELLDLVCSEYAKHAGIQYTNQFNSTQNECNCINTLLEIDLYPSLFTKWWEEEIAPLNYGIRYNRHKGDSIRAFDEIHYTSYEKLSKSPKEYKDLLIKYRDMDTSDYVTEENIQEFYSFLYINHWHYKNAFKTDIFKTPLKPHEIAHLQRLGKVFLQEYRKEKLCTIASTGKNFKEYLDELAKKI